MLAVKSMEVRENFKEWCNKVIDGETLIVSRPKNENVVIVSEKEYNEIVKAKRNAEYLKNWTIALPSWKMVKLSISHSMN